jgi:Regulatory CLIP domain of proteinases/Trypsin
VLNKLYNSEALLTPEIVEILEASKCEAVAASSDVCCPKLNETLATPEVETRFGEAADVCQTPTRQPGVCIPVRSCKFTIQLLSRRTQLTRQESDYLRNSQCGYRNRTPLVCCASGTTATPTTRQNQASFKALLPTFKTCGAIASNRIVGGRNTKVDEYPWLAMIEYADSQSGSRGFHCGASLITTQFTLTAAHCLSSVAIPSRFRP